jgi:MFS family permease
MFRSDNFRVRREPVERPSPYRSRGFAMPTPPLGPRDIARPGAVTVALSLVVLAFSLMQTLVVPALPTIGAELGATAQGTGWVITAFLLSGAVLAPVVGNLGDRFGHRRVLLGTLAVFALASAAAAAAPNMSVLLAARAVQGVSTATFPLALALARQLLHGRSLAAAFGWIPGMIGLGAGAALVVGGIVVDALGWRWLFALGTVLVAASAVAIVLLVPRGGAPAVSRSSDWLGTVLLAVGLVATLLAVSQGASWGWGSARTLATGIVGLLLLAVLVRVEARRTAPLVDVRTFRNTSLVLTSVLTVVVGFVPYVCYVAIPVLTQAPTSTGYGHGMSVTVSALAMLPSAVMVFLGGRLTPAMVARIGAGRTAAVASGAMAVGAALMAGWPTSGWRIVVAFGVLGLGNGIGYAICARLVVDFSPATETGAATGLNSVVRTVGSAAAAPVVGVLLARGGVDPASGFTAAFGVAAVAGVVGVVVAVLLARRPVAA